MGVHNHKNIAIPDEADIPKDGSNNGEPGSIYFIDDETVAYLDKNGIQRIFGTPSGSGSLSISSGPATVHNITHNLGREDLNLQVQLDDGSGNPGEYIELEGKPTTGDTLNSVTFKTIESVTIHVRIIT